VQTSNPHILKAGEAISMSQVDCFVADAPRNDASTNLRRKAPTNALFQDALKYKGFRGMIQSPLTFVGGDSRCRLIQ
jgi:hypothetical protein